MPVSYLIDSTRRVVFMRCWGVVTDRELSQGVSALLADPNFDPTYGRVTDFRETTKIDVRGDTVRRTGDALSRGSPARRASVVASDLVYGLVRMSQLSAESPPHLSLVCRDLESALAWVGLPPDAPWPPDPPNYAQDDSSAPPR